MHRPLLLSGMRVHGELLEGGTGTATATLLTVSVLTAEESDPSTNILGLISRGHRTLSFEAGAKRRTRMSVVAMEVEVEVFL